MIVGSRESAEIGAIAGAGRCHEEGRIGRLRLRGLSGDYGERRDSRNKAGARENLSKFGHLFSSNLFLSLVLE
jgi:hypothetical protein